MIFTQLEFVFFIAFVLLFLLLVKNFKAQKVFLLIASYYFYGYWNYTFLGLIFLCTLVNFYASIWIGQSNNVRTRKIILAVSLIFCLGVLGYYKYCNFFISSLQSLLGGLGWNVENLKIILPVGISFFTFQTMSYTIDVYRRDLKVCHNFIDFALFVAFFPQLVAGPIVRASEFLPQLETPRQMNWARTVSGTQQFMFGLLKKVLIADNLAFFVDHCFAGHSVYSGGTMLLAVLAYSLQIFCDFSGYSDMAIGLARLMGYDFNINFNVPYISRSVTEFWHRWHISLSTWLRDYLYIPLGGNRKGHLRTYVNLFLTMLLGGLWHGAAWNFVFWGAWHGAALSVHKFATERTKYRLPSFPAWLLTMLVVVVGWVFFRASSFTQAFEILGRVICWSPGVTWIDPFVAAALLLATAAHLLNYFNWSKLWELKQDSVWGATVLFLILYLVIIFRPTGFQPFIYFQF